MEIKKLKKILDEHKNWLNNEGGERADLSGVDLSRANLSGANLSRANLSRANLSEAVLYDTLFEKTKISFRNKIVEVNFTAIE